eukprot:scaffold2458_cov61-Phaeocystis_antarctica.AAC.4
MAANGEANDLPGDILSLHVELLGQIAKALPRDHRLAFSLAARPLNAARMNANLKLETNPRVLTGYAYSTPARRLWAESIGCPLPVEIQWGEKFTRRSADDQYTYLEELAPRMRCLHTCAHEP